MRVVALASALALFATPTLAQTYQVHGAGATSCGTWAQNRMTGGALAAVMETWVQGYISGLNAVLAVQGSGPDLAAGTDDDGMFAWMDNYCAGHPLDRVSSAAAALALSLDKRLKLGTQ